MTEQLSEAAQADRKKMRLLYEQAYKRFLDKLEIVALPQGFPLPYDLCEAASETLWSIPFAGVSIGDALCETINQLHTWYENLLSLSIWIEVLDQFTGEHDKLSVQSHFIEPPAFYCLMQPSAVRDRFGNIAIDALHLANRCSIRDYKDHFDPDSRKNPNRYILRTEREERLKGLGEHWSKSDAFIQALTALDSGSYRSATGDFRRRANHAVAQRFRLGEISFLTRSIQIRDELVGQSDGTYRLISLPTKKVVSYTFGYMRPLDLRAVYMANSGEYAKAVKVFESYQALLGELISAARVQQRKIPGTE